MALSLIGLGMDDKEEKTFEVMRWGDEIRPRMKDSAGEVGTQRGRERLR